MVFGKYNLFYSVQVRNTPHPVNHLYILLIIYQLNDINIHKLFHFCECQIKMISLHITTSWGLTCSKERPIIGLVSKV